MTMISELGLERERQDRIGRLVSALLHMDRTTVRNMLAAGSITQVEWLLVAALERIGALWEAGDASLSQVYMSGRICEETVLAASGAEPGQPRRHAPMAIAGLEDSHSLGKRLVRSVLIAAGYSVADYGQGIGAEALADRAVGEQIDVLWISTLMLRSALQIEQAVTRIRQARPRMKIVVGGAPFRFDKNLWKNVGADAVGYNASDACAIVTGWNLPNG
jgi:methanogenic corrinoid protein MtbC1